MFEVPLVVLFGVAVVVVLLTSVIKQVSWSDRTSAIVATVVSVVAAAVATLAAGEFNGENLLEASIVLYGLSQGFYQVIFKNTTPNAKLESVGTSRSTERRDSVN